MNHISELRISDKQYPVRLSKILKNKAPDKLYYLGNIELLSMQGLGFCGSRKASIQGLAVARDCAEQAASSGIVVISGNAAGVDFETHYNALSCGGNTILILPEGLSHFRVKRALQPVWDWERVLVISQFPVEAPWRPYQAMERNKLIIALSQAVIVIEAGETGGTLNAGKESLKLGMPLYVADYGDGSNALGNKILLGQGGMRLAKSQDTMKANMHKVFKSIGEDPALKRQSLQGSLF